MISGMELLLQAVERRDSVAEGSANGSAAGNEHVRPSSSLPLKKRMKLSFDASECGSLFVPGQDGARAVSVAGSSVASAFSHDSSHNDAPTVNSQWTDIARPHQAAENGIPQLRSGSVAVPNAILRDKKQASGKIASRPLKRRCGKATCKRKQSTSGVKDVDGNNVGMGYFSAILSCRTLSPPPAEAPVAERRAASLAGKNPQDADKKVNAKAAARATPLKLDTEVASPCKSDDEVSSIASLSLLYQAYLRALDQAASQKVNQQTAGNELTNCPV